MWRKARAVYLFKHPLCVMCQANGHVMAATVVDHITPHKGNIILFWDQSNWQSLCKPCHDGHKQSIEKGGAGRSGCDAAGMPTDKAHHWNR
jgi:5-methylcytosine-specific restriction endonuclease McrA